MKDEVKFESGAEQTSAITSQISNHHSTIINPNPIELRYRCMLIPQIHDAIQRRSDELKAGSLGYVDGAASLVPDAGAYSLTER